MLHYVNVPRRIKSAFRRGRLTDILLSSFYHSTRNPPASPRIEGTHQSATRQCEILKTIDKKGDVKIDLTFPWTITEVKLSVTSNLSLYSRSLFRKSATALRKYLFYCELSFLMQIIQWRKYNTDSQKVIRPWTDNVILIVIAL